MIAWVALLLAATTAYDAELSAYPYPFPVRHFELRAQRQVLRMAYMDVQPETPNGETVVLLHGKNFCGAYWEDTIRALSAQGYRTVVPDQIGFGKSSKPERFQFTFQELADDTRKLLDSLGVRRASLVGHSMGGMVATRFSLMFPDRVARLVLVNPIGLEDWKQMAPWLPVDQAYANELQNTPDKLREYMRVNYFGGTWKPEYEKLLAPLAGWLAGPDRERVAWDAALTSDMIFTQPVVHEFPNLRVPVMLIIGQRDRTAIGRDRAPEAVRAKMGHYPELGKRAAAAIPGAKLLEIENAGHLPQVEAFQAYREALLTFLPAAR
jgi:pimeloyl-ACP methyl ester carboxylesterase